MEFPLPFPPFHFTNETHTHNRTQLDNRARQIYVIPEWRCDKFLITIGWLPTVQRSLFPLTANERTNERTNERQEIEERPRRAKLLAHGRSDIITSFQQFRVFSFHFFFFFSYWTLTKRSERKRRNGAEKVKGKPSAPLSDYMERKVLRPWSVSPFFLGIETWELGASERNGQIWQQESTGNNTTPTQHHSRLAFQVFFLDALHCSQ